MKSPFLILFSADQPIAVRFRSLNCKKCAYRWIWKALVAPGSCPGCGARFFGFKVVKAKPQPRDGVTPIEVVTA